MKDKIKSMTDGAKQNWISVLIVLIPLIGSGYIIKEDVFSLKIKSL
jgi:hypothetical protein